MPRDGSWWLSELAGEQIVVMCVECELLRKMDQAELMGRFRDAPMPVLLDHIAEMIGCEKERTGLYNRCRLHYYHHPAGKVANQNNKQSLSLSSLCSWHVIVAACRCGHISHLEQSRIKRVLTPDITLDDLKTRLRCEKCKRKGDVTCTIAKLPR